MRLFIHCARIGVNLPAGMENFQRGLLRLHQSLGEEYKNFVQDNFEHEREPSGTAWTPLSPATAARKITKKKRRGFHPILRVTGRMANVHVRASASGVTIGSNVVYAPIHQFGARGADGDRIPARPWLFDRQGGVPQRFLDELAQFAARELEKCLS